MKSKYQSLTPSLLHILRDKGTEPAFSGDFIDVNENSRGTYLCRACGLALFREDSQFNSQCGWPSFDDQIPDVVKIQADADGRREEIVCARCDGHLGHVFYGENKTAKNTRHCVNSLSIEFVADESVADTEEIILAAGCFWGVQHGLRKLPGVLKTEVGYIGGGFANPTYEAVCTGNTGHFEAVRVLFDPTKTNLIAVLQLYFELHNFEQRDGQGPDIGSQYLSAIFYFDEQQKQTAETVIQQLTDMSYQVATQLLPMKTFWPAEVYHQDYFVKHGDNNNCHLRRKIFV